MSELITVVVANQFKSLVLQKWEWLHPYHYLVLRLPNLFTHRYLYLYCDFRQIFSCPLLPVSLTFASASPSCLKKLGLSNDDDGDDNVDDDDDGFHIKNTDKMQRWRWLHTYTQGTNISVQEIWTAACKGIISKYIFFWDFQMDIWKSWNYYICVVCNVMWAPVL